MVAWLVELLEFDIQYEPYGPTKTQLMTDFLAKFVGNDQTTLYWWSLHIDGASNIKGT